VLFPNKVPSRYAFRPAVYGQGPGLLLFTPIHLLVLLALPGSYACWSLLFFVLFSKSFFLQVKSQITRFFYWLPSCFESSCVNIYLIYYIGLYLGGRTGSRNEPFAVRLDSLYWLVIFFLSYCFLRGSGMNDRAAAKDEKARTDEKVIDGVADAGLGDGGTEPDGPITDESGKADAEAGATEAQDEAKTQDVVNGDSSHDALALQKDCRDESQHIDFVTMGMFIVGKTDLPPLSHSFA
jgi:hypothetical protein